MSSRIRILLVDDQPHFAELAKAFLEREDDRFVIDTADSAPTALERLESTEYDCVVSDFEMPTMSGLDLFMAIDERGVDLPFILFTAHEPEEIGDDRFEAVTAYLRKTGVGALEDLGRRIRLSVSEHRTDRELLGIQERYHALFEGSTMPMAWITSNGAGPVVVDHNDRFVEELVDGGGDPAGRHLEEALGDAVVDTGRIGRAMETGEPASIDGELVGEGGVKHYRWRVIPVADAEGSTQAHALVAAQDVSDRTTTDHALERYRTIVEASGDPMYVLDITGRFTYVNDALLEVTGLDRGELIGHSGREVMSGEDYDRGTELIRELLRSDDDSGTFEMDLHTADGRTIPCENHVTLIYDVETGDGDEVKGTAGVLRDISERQQHIAELRRHNERLEELAAFVSHDMRNPINIATGHLKLIDAPSDSKHYQAVWRALRRMEELVEDLLEMARSGQTVVDPSPIALDEAAKMSWSQVSTSPTASIEVTTDRTVVGDPSRIKQLFENLFTNAVMHGDGPVTVTVGSMADGFFVEDDGPGIHPDARDEVFEFGYTTDDSGTGFGLSIVKAVADSHEWDVTVTSGRAGGARFEFTGVDAVDTVGEAQLASHRW